MEAPSYGHLMTSHERIPTSEFTHLVARDGVASHRRELAALGARAVAVGIQPGAASVLLDPAPPTGPRSGPSPSSPRLTGRRRQTATPAEPPESSWWWRSPRRDRRGPLPLAVRHVAGAVATTMGRRPHAHELAPADLWCRPVSRVSAGRRRPRGAGCAHPSRRPAPRARRTPVGRAASRAALRFRPRQAGRRRPRRRGPRRPCPSRCCSRCRRGRRHRPAGRWPPPGRRRRGRPCRRPR